MLWGKRMKISNIVLTIACVGALLLTACEKKDAKYYVDSGYLSYSNGNNNKALKEFKKAIEIEPQIADFWLLNVCAQVSEKESRFSEAIEFYNKSIEMNPDYPDSYYNRAWAIKNGKKQ